MKEYVGAENDVNVRWEILSNEFIDTRTIVPVEWFDTDTIGDRRIQQDRLAYQREPYVDLRAIAKNDLMGTDMSGHETGQRRACAKLKRANMAFYEKASDDASYFKNAFAEKVVPMEPDVLGKDR